MNLVFGKKTAKWVIMASFLAIGGVVVTGCSKEKDQIETSTGLEKGKLTISVHGVKEGAGKAHVKSSTAATGASKSSQLVEFEEFDAQLTVGDVVPGVRYVSGASQNGGAALQASASALRAEAVESGVTYKLWLLSADGATVVSSHNLSSGATAAIDVAPGEDYKWVAFSYNNTDDISALDVTASIDLTGDKDVLYASGDISVPANGDGLALPINFERKLSRLAIELNSMGMFAQMSNASLSISGDALQTATLDLASGDLSDFTSYTKEVTLDDLTQVEEPYNDVKYIYVYTANAGASGINVAVSDLEIVIDDNTTRSFSNTANFSFANVTPLAGSSHPLQVNLIESPLTIEGTRWARQNLYYEAGRNPYRFHHTYAHTQARNTFFSFKGEVPDRFGSNGDPCALVYPEDVWKTAAESDYRKLTGFLGVGGKTATYGTSDNRGYAEFDATGTAAPYPSNKLRFNFNGGSTAFSVVNGLVNLTLGSFGTRAEYWSASTGVGSGTIVGLGAWYYHAERAGSQLLGYRVNDDLSLNLLSVTAIGIDILETQMKNIRCVRAD